MRTTLTLDDDLLRDLKRVARETQTPLKKVIDRVLRRGLRADEAGAAAKARPLPSFDMGVFPGVNLDKALALSAEIDDAEVSRKLAMRK